MKRYQIYLNPQSVTILDEIQKLSNITRSKIIRDAIDKIATQIMTTIPIKRSAKKHFVLDDLALRARKSLKLAGGGERRDRARHVVGRASHEPVGRLGPEAVQAAAHFRYGPS